jgi:hypothetical protein
MWCPASLRYRRSTLWRPGSTGFYTPGVRRYQIPGAAMWPSIRPLSVSRTRSEAGQSAGIDLEQSFSPCERTLGMRFVSKNNRLLCCGFSRIGRRFGSSAGIDQNNHSNLENVPLHCVRFAKTVMWFAEYSETFLKFAGISVYIRETNLNFGTYSRKSWDLLRLSSSAGNCCHFSELHHY